MQKLIHVCVSMLTLLIAGTVSGCLQDQDKSSQASDVPSGVKDLRITLDKPEYGYQISSEAMIVPTGSEKVFCSIVKISPHADEKLVWINRFESLTSNYTHHMNVHVGVFSVLDAFLAEGTAENVVGKDLGTYECSELGDLMEEQGTVPVYPSQITHQIGALPAGVAVPGVTPLVLIMEHHYINTTEQDVLVNAMVNFETVEEQEVEHILTGFFGIRSDIDIPPNSRKIETSTCRIDRDINMVGISSHSHLRGDCFTLNKYDGETSSVAEDPFFVNKNWETPPIVFFDHGEWALNKGDGIHWGCHWNNREDRHVTDGGSASDEMCIFVGVGYPSKLSVQDVKDIMEDPLSVDFDSISKDAIINCDKFSEPSPFPITGEVLDESTELCSDYEQTAPRMDLSKPLEISLP